ncbi:MAG: DUF1854 domain-containing protein [Clostridiales bacterium]|jgi:putative uncharacterized protein (fragment)|nr:DUF1854 domain-containing protein [Clostridiales bacterium]
MARLYVNGDEVRFTRRDMCSVDAEFYDGKRIENLEPRRLFPVSGMTRYITLLDEDGKEQAIIRNIDTLMPESKKVIEACLREYYLIPKIKRLIDSTEKYGILKWTVETDRGMCSFEIRNRHSDIKMLYDGRVLVRDSNDNRYEIPDYRTLDKHSMVLLNTEL